MVLLNMAIFGIYVNFLGCILFVISLQLMFVRPNLGMKFSSESGLKYRNIRRHESWDKFAGESNLIQMHRELSGISPSDIA